MERIAVLLLALTFAGLTAGATSAHPNRSSIDRREARQHQRIHAGWKHGQLTRGEAKRLRAGQRHIRRMERRGRADGHLSLRERAHIQRELNQQNRRIHRMRHNGRSI